MPEVCVVQLIPLNMCLSKEGQINSPTTPPDTNETQFAFWHREVY